ncbi:MAG: hypothetical protein VX768_16520 [Planctomycetota bacterium]|nr:hypothetical protein [Planctomycetota bacterium]
MATLPACFSLTCPTVVAQAKAAEKSTISDQACFVLKINVQRLIGLQKMGSQQLKLIQQFFEQNAGLDIMQMKSITFQNFNLPEENSGFQRVPFAMTMEFSRKFDRNKFMKKVAPGTGVEARHLGQTYLKPADSERDPHFFFPDEKTIVMATPFAIEAVIKATLQEGGRMAKRIAAAPGNAECSMAFQSSPALHLLIDNFADEVSLSQLPVNPIKSFKTMQSGVGHIDLRSSTLLFVRIECKNRAAARQFQGLTEVLIETARLSIEPMENEGKKIENQAPEAERTNPSPAASAQRAATFLQKGLRAGVKAINGASVSCDEASMTLSVTRRGGLPEVGEWVADLFNLFGARNRAFEDPDHR